MEALHEGFLEDEILDKVFAKLLRNFSMLMMTEDSNSSTPVEFIMIICCHPDATIIVFCMRLVASLISAALDAAALEDEAVEVTCRRPGMRWKPKSDPSASAVAKIVPSLVLWKAATNLPSFGLWKALKSTGRYVMANDFK